MNAAPDSLDLGDRRIAFVRTGGADPGAVFLGGFMSDMTGTKATALEAAARAAGRAFLRFDYSGHGTSSGDFEQGTIGRWREEALAVLDRLTQGPQILVGSSMGGWIALLAALARPERVAGLVLVAPAPDFTERLMWQVFPEEVRREIMETGRHEMPSAYGDDPCVVTRALIEDGRRHLLLDGEAPIPIACPVRILHGQRDEDVPWRLSTELAGRLAGEDVVLTLVKSGDHRLSAPADIDRLGAALGELARHR